MKDSIMARYCHNCTFLRGFSFKQHEESQINIILWVQFFEPVAKIFFWSNLQSWNFVNFPA